MTDNTQAQGRLACDSDQPRKRRAPRATAQPRELSEPAVLPPEYELIAGALDATNAPAVVLDREGRIVHLNGAGEQMTGYTRQEMRGKTLWDALVARDESAGVREALARLPGEKGTIAQENTWTTKNGSRRLIRWSGAAVSRAQSTIYVVVTGTDITDERRTEEAFKLEEMRLNSLLELTQSASELREKEIIQLTLEEVVKLTQSKIGYLHLVNPDQETIQLYAWSEETLKTCTAEYVSHYPIAKAGVWADCARHKRPVVHNDYQGLPNRSGYPDGHSHLVRHVSIPILDSERVTVILGVGNKESDYNQADVRQMVLAADSLWKIIRRKRAEEELRRHVHALQEADRQKDEFLAMLGHELRNPLAPISHALSILELPRADSESVEKARKTIRRQLEHMTRLVDDLLDVSRITQGKIKLQRESVDLAEVIRHAVDVSRSLIDERGHELTVQYPDCPLPVFGDAVRLGQIVANLLNNAAKYTRPGGQIRVIADRDGSDAMLRVEDTGVGISPDLLPRVFDQFAQGDHSLDRSRGGLGLGLTLVHKLADLHAGSVQAHSGGTDQGSQFMVRLPLADDEPTSDGPEEEGASAKAALECRRILVVDDNVDAASMLVSLLKAHGHQVHPAHNGPSALEAASWLNPDVVLLDIGLPEMDGYEVARRLRRDYGSEQMLLVALTGYGHEEAIRQGVEAGFDRHLVKPLQLDVLLQLLADGPNRSPRP